MFTIFLGTTMIFLMVLASRKGFSFSLARASFSISWGGVAKHGDSFRFLVVIAMLCLPLCGCAHSPKVELAADADVFARKKHLAEVRCRTVETQSHFRFADKYLPPFKAAAELRVGGTFEVLRWERGAMGVDLLTIKNATIIRNDLGSFLRTNNLYLVGFDEVSDGFVRGTVTIGSPEK